MTQQTELEKFKEQLAKNQKWLDIISTRRARQDQEWFDDVATERVKVEVLNEWLDEIIEKQAKEAAN